MFWLGYCNSMMNPIIYTCASRDFKQAFVRILRCRQRQPFARCCCCCHCCRPRRASSSFIGSPRFAGTRYNAQSTSVVSFSGLPSRRCGTAAAPNPFTSASSPSSTSVAASAAAAFHVVGDRCASSATGLSAAAVSGSGIYRSATTVGRSVDGGSRSWLTMTATGGDDVIVADDDAVGSRQNGVTSSQSAFDNSRFGRRSGERCTAAAASASTAAGGLRATLRSSNRADRETFGDRSRACGLGMAVRGGEGDGVPMSKVDDAQLMELTARQDGSKCRQYRQTRMSFPSSFGVGAAASAME